MASGIELRANAAAAVSGIDAAIDALENSRDLIICAMRAPVSDGSFLRMASDLSQCAALDVIDNSVVNLDDLRTFCTEE